MKGKEAAVPSVCNSYYKRRCYSDGPIKILTYNKNFGHDVSFFIQLILLVKKKNSTLVGYITTGVRILHVHVVYIGLQLLCFGEKDDSTKQVLTICDNDNNRTHARPFVYHRDETIMPLRSSLTPTVTNALSDP